MTGTSPWFEEQLSRAPAALGANARRFLAQAAGEEAAAERLAEAGKLALVSGLAQGEARAAALDLLTADALITLALHAQSESAPGALDAFAARILEAASA